MNIDEYIKNNPDFAKKIAERESKLSGSSAATSNYSSTKYKDGTANKLALYSFLLVIPMIMFSSFIFITVANYGKSSPVFAFVLSLFFILLTALCGIFSLAYLIAAGVYIGNRS